MKKVTLRDIADQAGVSVVTVSKVLNKNNSRAAKPETVELIERLAQELGYTKPCSDTPDTMEFGIIVIPSDVDIYSHPYYSDVLSGIREMALELKATISFIHSLSEVNSTSEMAAQVLGSGVKNVIIMGESYGDDLGEIKNCFENVVGLLTYEPDIWTHDVVITDTYAAAREVMLRLLDSGRRRIMFMGPEYRPDVHNNNQLEGRLRAYINVLEEKGLDLEGNLFCPCDFDPDRVYQQLTEILDQGTRYFDAVFACDDMMAMAAIKALHEHNILIPDEVAVIGFNNQDFCNYSFPPLSTVDLNSKTLGKLAVEMLRIKNTVVTSLPLKLSIPSRFVLRESGGGKYNQRRTL